MAGREFLDTEEVRGSNPRAPTTVVARVTIGLGVKEPSRLRIREPRSGSATPSSAHRAHSASATWAFIPGLNLLVVASLRLRKRPATRSRLCRSHLGPPAAGHRSRTYCSARGAESGRACQAAVRGPELTAVRTGSSDPSGRGWRPSPGSPGALLRRGPLRTARTQLARRMA
jgi:hypothetical protein